MLFFFVFSDERLKVIGSYLNHLENLIGSKDMLSNYIQQPFSEDENFLPIEPKFQKKLVSLFQHFSQQIYNVDQNIDSIKWIHSIEKHKEKLAINFFFNYIFLLIFFYIQKKKGKSIGSFAFLPNQMPEILQNFESIEESLCY